MARIFNPNSTEPFAISRSKIDLFLNCPRCFYLEARLGISRPRGFPFTLNSAVDTLLKKEFDIHRAKGQPHPLMEHYGIKAVPFVHEKMDEWRNTFVGVRCLHQPNNFIVFGAIDDIWKDETGQLLVVDYKATAKDSKLSLDAPWQIAYKRQMEIYQWLLRQNDFKVSDTGYFVYANGRKDKEAFDAKLEFDVEILPYTGDGSWIEGTLSEIRQCLESEQIPAPDSACEHCQFVSRSTLHFK